MKCTKCDAEVRDTDSWYLDCENELICLDGVCKADDRF